MISARRTGAIFRRVVAEIRRDHRSLALLFVVPLVVTGLLTYILREGAVTTVHAVIVNEAGPAGIAVTRALTSGLTSETPSATVSSADDEASARALVRNGTASVAIVLPPDLASGGAGEIRVVTLGMNPSDDAAQVAALQRAIVSAVATLAGRQVPRVERETIYGVPSDDPMTAYAPAIVGFFVYFFVYLLTGVSFLRERTGGTLERLMATPVTRGDVVAGYTLGFALFAVVEVLLLMLWSLGSARIGPLGPLPEMSIGLGIALAGSPLLGFVVVLLVAIGAVCLGIFLSTFARTELQIAQFIPVVIVPQFLLSGVLFPVGGLPSILQPIAPLLPLTYAVDGLRQVFARGADLGTPALALDVGALAVFALIFAGAAALTIRRDVV